MTPRVAALGLVLLGLAAGGVAWLGTQRHVEVALVHPEVEAARLAAWLEAVRAAPRPPAEQLQPVVEAFSALNRAEVAADARPGKLPHEDHTYAARLDALQVAAEAFVVARGTEALVWVGRRRGIVLAGALRDWLATAKAKGLDATEALDDPAAAAYVDAGGVFVRFAVGGGFVSDGALREDRLALLQALFVHHWLGLMRPKMALDGFLRADEREWMLRWRVEFQTGAPLDRRLAAADALRAVPGYPAALNASVLLYQAGRPDDAAARLEGLADPMAVAYRRAYRRGTER